MTQNELNEVLSLHKQWLKSDGAEGKRANLKRANLKRANLNRANLNGTNLNGADLSGAYLYSADLSGADLCRANLNGADLKDANLHRADLSGADLSGADLYLADLSGANLDHSVWPLWCGSFNVKCDIRLASQLAYHFCSLECDDAGVIAAQNALLGLANKFHRARERGVLEPKQTTKLSNNKKEGEGNEQHSGIDTERARQDTR